MDRRHLLWAIAILIAIHNAEEALTFRRNWPELTGRLQTTFGIHVAATPRPIYWALALVTVIATGIVVRASRRPQDPGRLWAALLIQGVMLLNVASHIAAASWIGGYAPGLVTALVLNLPFSFYLFKRAVDENWVSRRASLLLLPTVAIIHGPGLLGMLWLVGVVS
jgi:hypothetical protein